MFRKAIFFLSDKFILNLSALTQFYKEKSTEKVVLELSDRPLFKYYDCIMFKLHLLLTVYSHFRKYLSLVEKYHTKITNLFQIQMMTYINGINFNIKYSEFLGNFLVYSVHLFLHVILASKNLSFYKKYNSSIYIIPSDFIYHKNYD